MAWAFDKIRADADAFVRDAEFADEAVVIQAGMVDAAVEAIRDHLIGQGDLRSRAIADGLIQD